MFRHKRTIFRERKMPGLKQAVSDNVLFPKFHSLQ
jgi:hypothetical protein